MNYDDAFTLEMVSDSLVDKFNYVAGIVPVLTTHLSQVYMLHDLTCWSYDVASVRLHEKTLSWWGQTSQQSLDSGCFELVSSHQQGIRVTCLAHHMYMYMRIATMVNVYKCVNNPGDSVSLCVYSW